MVDPPPIAPTVGLTHRVRLGRDFYVRIDSNDYFVATRAIGRFIDVLATPGLVVAICEAEHTRSRARELAITDPEHRVIAKTLRADLAHRCREMRATHPSWRARRGQPGPAGLRRPDRRGLRPRPDQGMGPTAEGTR